MGILLLAWYVWADVLVDVFTKLSSQISTIAHSWLRDCKDQTIALVEYLPVFPSIGMNDSASSAVLLHSLL